MYRELPGGTVAVKLPVPPVTVPASIRAFVACPNCNVESKLFAAVALTVTCNRSAPIGCTSTVTGGRGAQFTGSRVAVGVMVGVAVGVLVGVLVWVGVAVAVA